MENEKNPVRVEIMGVKYRLKRTEEEAYLNKVAEKVDSLMKEIAEKYSVVSSDRIAVLAALRLCDAWFRDIEQSRKADAEAASVVEELSGTLKRALR